MYSLIFLVVILSVTAWGYVRGFLRVFLRLLVVLACYAFAWQETPALANFLASKGWVNGLIVWPVASFLLFFGGSLIFGYLASLFVKLAPEEWQDERSIGGAALGLVLGGVLAVITVWAVGIMTDAQQLRSMAARAASGISPGVDVGNVLEKIGVQGNEKSSEPLSTPDNEGVFGQLDASVRKYSAVAVAETGQHVLSGNKIAPAVGKLLQEPVVVGEELKYLIQQTQLTQLFQDPVNFSVLNKGSLDDIMKLKSFRDVQSDLRAMKFMATAGLQGADVNQQARELAQQLQNIAHNVERLRNTDDFKAVATDSGIIQQWQQGNYLVLLANEKIRRLVQQLLYSPASGTSNSLAGSASKLSESVNNLLPDTGGKSSSQSSEKPVQESAKAYRWQDADGGWHYTEEKPPAGVKYKEVLHDH
jgi:hypothetical protein